MRKTELQLARFYLPLAMGCMTMLGTLLLGLGQRSFFLPLLALFASTTAVYFTDWKGWFKLDRMYANLAALLAVGYSLIDFFHVDRESQLLAVANLLVYLQVVLLYQEKNERTYWQLVMLSLLQTVVASALSLGAEFGLLLVGYLLIALLTLALLVICREMEPRKTTAPAERGLAWFGAPVVLGRSATGHEPRSIPIRPLLGQVLRMAVWTLLVAVLFFCAVPRSGEAVWRGPGQAIARTGYSDEVNLRRGARLRQNLDPVFRVTFHRPESDEPLALSSDLYFRGDVRGEYRDGEWLRPAQAYLRDRQIDPSLPLPKTQSEMLVQEITLEPTQEDTLFSAFPAYQLPGSRRNDVFFDSWFQHMYYGDLGESQSPRAPPPQFHYSLGTTAFRNGGQRAIVPATTRTPRRVLEDPASLLRLPSAKTAGASDPLARLKEIAVEAIRAAGAQNASRLHKARVLESHFQTPGLYEYTLEPPAQKPGDDVDPIVRFVDEHKQGHCQYFATALVLMLRSQGIPARLALGFHGGEFNSVGNYYTVRQLHAHAWVEVFLEPEDVPEGEKIPGEVDEPLRPDDPSDIARGRARFSKGYWLRLDPTPSSGALDDVAGANGPLARLGELIDYVQTLWSDYVLGLNYERQQSSIYKPFLTRLRGFLSGMFDGRAWSDFFRRMIVSAGLELDSSSASWFNWRAAIWTMVGGFLLAALGRGLWRSWEMFRDWRARQRPAVRRGPRIAFYDQFEQLLARHGLRRALGQTQREFAQAVGRHLSASTSLTHLAALPAALADAFYRARYSRQPLDNAELAQVEQAVGRLQLALAGAAQLGKET